MSEPAIGYEFEAKDDDAPASPSNTRLVARISIQAFCFSQQVTETVSQAIGDRRLSRAHVTVEPGDIRAAISYFANSPTPNLLIVESEAETNQIITDIEELAGVCDEGTNVIVIGHRNDVLLYRELIRRGVSDYIVAPITALQLVEAVTSVYEDPEKGLSGNVTAFIGAKGGVGSSTVAHNVSWAIAELVGEDTVIADLDLAFGTVGLDFNQDPPQGIADALNTPDRLDPVLLDRLLSKCTDKLSLFAAPSTLDREFDIDQDALQTVVDLLRSTVPTISLDLPHQWSTWTKRALLDADRVVITAIPDLANLRNTKNFLDVLRNLRPNDEPPYLVINQIGIPKRPEISLQDFSEAVSAEPILTIPFDPQLFGTAANNGQMIAELPTGTKVATGFIELAKEITGHRVAAIPRKSRKARKAHLPKISLNLFRWKR